MKNLTKALLTAGVAMYAGTAWAGYTAQNREDNYAIENNYDNKRVLEFDADGLQRRNDVMTTFDEFWGDSVDVKHVTLAGTNTTVAVTPTVVEGDLGYLINTTGSSGASPSLLYTINGSQFCTGKNFDTQDGGLVGEASVRLGSTTAVAVFVGFTDTNAIEFPGTISGTTVTNNATDAVGFIYDTSSTADNWIGVAASGDATATVAANVDTGTSPSTAFQKLKVKIGSDGLAQFAINDVYIGSVANAMASSATNLAFCVSADTRTGASKTVVTDYINVKKTRPARGSSD